MDESRKHDQSGQYRVSLQQLDLLVRQIDALPTPLGVAARLIELCFPAAGENRPMDDDAWTQTVQLIGFDQALTARLLRMANSATAKVPQSPAEAASYLGTELVRSLVLSVKVPKIADDTDRDDEFDLESFWLHCLAVATATELLSEQLHLPIDPDEAFTCGLLHDLGKLALREMLPKSYRRVIHTVAKNTGSIAEHERNIIGLDHTIVGRRLAEHWRLAQTIQQVIWMHHQPIEAIPTSLPDRKLVTVVTLADTLVREQGIGFSGNYAFPRSSADLAGQLDISPEQLKCLTSVLSERIEQRTKQVNLDEPTTERFYRKVLTSANAELVRMNEQLLRRGEQLDLHAQAFRHLHDFASRLSDKSTVSDALVDIARQLIQIQPLRDSDRPIVVYSVGHQGRDVLALRYERSERMTWRSFQCGQRFDPQASDKTAGWGLDMLSAFGGNFADIAEWIELDKYRHETLICASRWVGGLLYPSPEANGAPSPHCDVIEALGAALGMALGIVQGRCQAVELSEQLTGASGVLAETEQALSDAKALGAVSEMAAGAAHEMNSALAVISGRAQLMGEKSQNDAERKVWTVITDQAQRISDTITDLMEFASPPAPNPKQLDVRELLQSAVNMFTNSDHPQAKSVHVDIETVESLPPIWADGEQISSAICELITNAVTAAGAKRSIRLAAETNQLARTVLLTVADSGPGMDERTLNRAFAPFFSLQTAGRRRGLGLSRIKRSLENNGGRVWIRSEVGKGTTVFLELPFAADGNGEEKVKDA